MERRSLLRATALGGLAGLAGCGVASRNGVVVDGPGQPGGTGPIDSKQQPVKRELVNRPEDLVRGLFSQAAGDLGDPSQALLRWRAYMPPDRKFTTSTEVMVVWCDFDKMQPPVPTASPTPLRQGENTVLIVPVVPLGRLEADGRVTPNLRDRPVNLAIEIGQAPLDSTKDQAKVDRSLWVLDVFVWNAKEPNRRDQRPTTMLLSTEALDTYYEYRNVYFWEKGLTCLVPDARYVPTAWEDATRRKKLVEWLFAGPSSWLAGAVELPAPGVKVIDIPGPTGRRLVVNLSAEVAKENLGRLVSQLTWTLLREVAEISTDPVNSPITIKIESIEKKVGGRYANDNATAFRTGSPQSIEAFAIVDKKVARIKAPLVRRNPPPGIDPALNEDVEWAAYYRDMATQAVGAVALVRRDKGSPELHIGPKTNLSAKMTKVARAELGSPETILQPAFIDAFNLLVVADGRLYCVQRTTGVATGPFITGVQAFAVPPDGRRIAYIRGGRLFIAALPMIAGRVSFGEVHEEVRTILTNLTGVAFTAENWLAVSGLYQGEVRVVEISLDGGRVGGHTPDGMWLGGAKEIPAITSLTAFPDSPYESVSTKRVYVTAGGEALNATSNFSSLTTELVDPVPGKLAIHPFFMQ